MRTKPRLIHKAATKRAHAPRARRARSELKATRRSRRARGPRSKTTSAPHRAAELREIRTRSGRSSGDRRRGGGAGRSVASWGGSGDSPIGGRRRRRRRRRRRWRDRGSRGAAPRDLRRCQPRSRCGRGEQGKGREGGRGGGDVTWAWTLRLLLSFLSNLCSLLSLPLPPPARSLGAALRCDAVVVFYFCATGVAFFNRFPLAWNRGARLDWESSGAGWGDADNRIKLSRGQVRAARSALPCRAGP